jgi:hypothetical protein
LLKTGDAGAVADYGEIALSNADPLRPIANGDESDLRNIGYRTH